MKGIDDLSFQKTALQRRRGELLQDVARIDQQLAVIQSCELEMDLNADENRPQ